MNRMVRYRLQGKTSVLVDRTRVEDEEQGD